MLYLEHSCHFTSQTLILCTYCNFTTEMSTFKSRYAPFSQIFFWNLGCWFGILSSVLNLMILGGKLLLIFLIPDPKLPQGGSRE